MTTPEHLHLALNHLPFLGAGFAIIPLALGFVAKNRQTVLAGLLLAVLSGWFTPIVMATGESAGERYEKGSRFLDPEVERFLENHEHRAEAWSKAMYANAAIATLCLGLLLRKPGWTRPLSAVAIVFCLGSLVSGIWIAESGGLIRRPDFRGDQVPGVPKSSRLEQGHRDDV